MTKNWTHLSSLEILDVSNNRLRHMDHVSFPSSLTSILVTNNDIADVPPEWALLERLQTLSLSGDPPCPGPTYVPLAPLSYIRTPLTHYINSVLVR